MSSSTLVRPAKPAFSAAGGGAVPSTPIRYAKLTQIVDGRLRCALLKFGGVFSPALVLSGNDGGYIPAEPDFYILPGQTLFTEGDPNADPPVPAPQPGNFLELSGVLDAGTYLITQIVNPRRLRVAHTFQENQIHVVPWRIVVQQQTLPGWEVDYGQMFDAIGLPAAPEQRYRPYLGPGDHFGSDLVSTADSATVSSAAANFADPLNPVLPGMFIDIGGPDVGLHRIANANTATELELDAPLTAAATNLPYRIAIASDHAPAVALLPVAGHLVAVPEQDSLEVKIARPIRNTADADNFDTFRELGTTEAKDLLDSVGPYLACYRLQTTASEQGLPVDDRVIIAAKPWRGHAVGGVLFFDDQVPAQPKYDLSDPDEPVWPIRWVRDGWRLEIAVGRDTRQEPTQAETCT